MLNVCSPSPEEQQEIASALARIPKQPLFSPDFEVDRGRSTLDQSPDFLKAGVSAQFSSDSGTADWVRIRREFSVQALFSTVQYSFSRDPKNMVETLIFHVRDPKDLMQVAIEDNASAVTTPATMLSTSTPASRIKLERFGKVVGGAGPLCWNGRKSCAGSKRLRAAISERNRDREPTIAIFWRRGAPCPRSWRGSAVWQRPRQSPLRRRRQRRLCQKSPCRKTSEQFRALNRNLKFVI